MLLDIAFGFRITPMCMGSTDVKHSQYRCSQNHPHVYGEYLTRLPICGTVLESPPCVWGVRHCVSYSDEISRITPMCMGSTDNWLVTGTRTQNHPHVYGEYSC